MTIKNNDTELENMSVTELNQLCKERLFILYTHYYKKFGAEAKKKKPDTGCLNKLRLDCCYVLSCLKDLLGSKDRLWILDKINYSKEILKIK